MIKVDIQKIILYWKTLGLAISKSRLAELETIRYALSIYEELPESYFNFYNESFEIVIQNSCVPKDLVIPPMKEIKLSPVMFTVKGRPVYNVRVEDTERGKLVKGTLDENVETWNLDGSYYEFTESEYDLME